MTSPIEHAAAPGQEGPPRGFLRPEGKREALAVKALAEDRLEDAAKHISALPEHPARTRAWKLYLDGLLRLKTRDFDGAESALLQSASVAWVWALSEEELESPTPFRLAALALEKAGVVQRREERAAEAASTHAAAYRLRVQHGSVEEQWESALSQGTAHSVAKNYPAAMQWQTRALDFAGRSQDGRHEMLALTHAQLAITSREMGQLGEAVVAARQSLDHWRNHDLAAVTVAEGEFRLGDLLAARGEQQMAVESDAMPALTESIERLRSAADSLAAFGGEHDKMARLCQARLDFAQRLFESISSTAS
jgi:tetratricopeptide (TPR) repeat protein